MARIHLETKIEATIEIVFDLARDIDFHQRSLAHTSERAVAGRTHGLIGLGETVTWRARHFGLPWTLTSRVTDFHRPTMFADEQIAGPFKSFRHEHRFLEVPGGTVMIYDWTHVAPLGWLGRVVDALVLTRWMERVLQSRASAIATEAQQRSASSS